MPPRVGGTKRIISAHLQDLGGETYKCYETSPKSVFEKPHHRNTRPLQNFILYEGILDFRQLYVDTPEIIIITLQDRTTETRRSLVRSMWVGLPRRINRG